MGWTGTHRAKGMTDAEFFTNEFPSMLGTNGNIIACSTIKSVFYAVVEQTVATSVTPVGNRWALIVMIQRTRNDYWNFHYKEMDETMGPSYSDMPEYMLEMLSPTEHQYALAWREDCRKTIAKKQARPRVKKGDTVVFERPLRFSNGECAEFVFNERSTFHIAGFPTQRYRIPNWRERPHEIKARP